MIRRTFTFESDSQPCPASHNRLAARLTVCIAVSCRDPDGATAAYEIESITNGDYGDEDVALSALSEREQLRLAELAQSLADNAAPHAWQEHWEAQAAWEADRIRDDCDAHGDSADSGVSCLRHRQIERKESE